MKKAILFIIFMTYTSVFAQKADAILGLWLPQDKDGKVEIYKQGNAYFAKITELVEPADPKTGKPYTDTENPDKSKRNQPIVGLVVIKNLKYIADKKIWDDGDVYDPKRGKTYSLKITMKDNNKIVITGYIGVPMLGQSETWTRIK
ncbi:MAG: DUF2147 domain-containing protein [Spirosomataceae bacterium]